MLSVLVFILVLSILIVVHEFGHFIAAKRSGVRVETFALGFGPKIFCKKYGQTEYKLCAIPLGGYVKLAGDNLDEYKGNKDEYLGKPLFSRFKIIFAGPFLNYILGIFFLWVVLFFGYPSLTTKVGGVVDGLGAKAAGILAGDKIIAVEGKRVNYWEDLQKEIQANRQKTKILVTFIRDSQEQSLYINLNERPVTDVLGQKRNVGLIGIIASDEMVKIRRGFIQSFILSWQKAYDLTIMTYKSLWLMVSRKLSVRESVTGPLGMFYITSKAADLGITALLHVIAVLSISLGIFNLLPLPALDGGHIVLLLVEKIRGKYLSKREEQIFTNIGLSLIIFLAVVVFINDLDRFGVFAKITKWLGK